MFQPSSLVMHQVSGFTVEIATTADSEFCGFTEEIEEFLCAEAEIVARVAAFSGVELLQLELDVSGTTRFRSNYRFPPSLLRLLADLNLPLEVAVCHEDGIRELPLGRETVIAGLD